MSEFVDFHDRDALRAHLDTMTSQQQCDFWMKRFEETWPGFLTNTNDGDPFRRYAGIKDPRMEPLPFPPFIFESS